MNKIIAAFDGLKFATSTKQYAMAIASTTQSHLTGVFLDDQTYTSYKIYDMVIEDGVSEHRLRKFKEQDNERRRNASIEFESDCISHKIEYNIHHDRDVALPELLHETLFSDLLVINSGESFTHHEEQFPTRFIRDVLSNTQCSVLLTPEIYSEINKIVFLYDGKPASIYTLKMANLLMPNFKSLPLELICVKPLEDNLHLPDNKLIKELLKRHYNNIEFTILKGIPEVEIINHLNKDKNNFMLILGAYRRTMLSRWFKSSMADAIIKSFNAPLFISHNK